MMDTAKGVNGTPKVACTVHQWVLGASTTQSVEKYGGMLENLSHTDP